MVDKSRLCSTNDEYESLKQVNKQLLQEIGKLQKQMEKLEAQITRHRDRTEELQLKLIDKHSQISQLQMKNEHLVNEFIRNTPQLYLSGNKADAVRLIAEVTAIITTANAESQGTLPDSEFQKAEKYLEESEAQIRERNFSGAIYLAKQAKELLREAIKRANRKRKREHPSEVLLQSHISMIVLMKCNVRERPSMEGKILHVYSKGRRVKALGYHGNWVKIKLKKGGNAWIHCSILNCPQEWQDDYLSPRGGLSSR